MPTGTTPPSTCKATNTNCTTNAVPAITIVKTATPTTVTKVGQTITYKFVATNTGGTSLTNVSVTDKFTSPSSDKLSTPIKCIPATTTGTCTSSTTTANLGIGQHATFEVTYKVTSGDLANGVINNSATASGNSATPNNPTKTTKVTSPPSTASVATANLVTSKIVSPASGTNVTPGEVLTYTLTFANTKGTAAAPVNYTDNLADVLDDATVTTPPALATGSGLTVSSITTTKGTFTVTGTVPAKTVDTVTYKVTVDAVTKDTTGNHVLNNYLVPTGTTPPSTCKATNTNCTTNAVPAITIVKTATPTTVTKVGQTITYKFVATNTGGTSLTNVSVTDKFTSPSSDKLSTPIKCIPATTTGTCTSSTTTANLGIGQHATFEVTYKVTSGDLANGVINNSATASGNSATPNNPTKTTKVTSPPSTASVATANLVTSKIVSPASGTNVTPGEVLTYTLTFANTKGTAAAPVNYTDNLADVLDDATVTTPPALATGSGLTVSSITTTKGTFTVTGTVPAKTVDTVTYKVTVDAVTKDTTGNHVLNNYLVPTGTTPPSTCKATNTNCTTNAVPAITIVKTATPTTVTKVGQTITYKFVATNTGGTSLTNVSVTDKFTSPSSDKLSTPIKCIPATTTGTCTSSTTTANLGIGQHATFEVTYKVTSGDLANGVINNSATASGNSATPNNPTKTTKVTSPPSTASVATANLVTSKIVSPASGTNVTPGEVLTYTLTFANTKGTAAAPVNYTDNLADVLDDATVTTPPALATGSGLTVSSITTTKGTFTVTGTVPAKTVDTVTYKVTVDAVTKDTTGNHVLNNYLVPTGTTPPSTCKATNTNCTTNAVPAITIVKTATPTTVTKVGQTITYKFVATNTGGTSLTNVSVTDKFTSPSSDKLSTPIKCIPATTTGTCTSSTTTANLGIGQHATFEVTYKVTSGDLANGVINNSATASGNSATPNNPTKTTKVTSPPSTASVATANLVTSKIVSPASGTNVTPGEVLTYTLTFANTKGTAAAPVNYTDNLADVLDDATVTTPPALATGSGLTVSSISGTKGTSPITGTVPAKTVDTVTYKVTVDAVTKDTTGNHVLNNYLVPTGTTPPSTCKATNTNCTTNAVPAITIVKTATPTTVTKVGQTITYKFVATNTGGTSLTNVSVTDKFTSPSSDKLSTPIKCIPATTTGTCTSSTTTANLGIGQHATFEVTYKVTSGDLANGVINNSATASGNSATPNNPTKTTKVTSPPSTASVATANLVTSKIVSPASGTNVTPGEVLTYTLTFANTKGTAAAPVNYTDNLADVLDDATVTTPPALATGSGLTVSSITTTKGTFTVTGTVPAKTVDTVTYKVTVDAVTKDTTGNHVLNNYLVPTGTTPPSTCKATNTNCTTNAVPAITIVKTATPTTVTKVGQTITYKFVATNTGGTSLTNVSVTDKFTSPSSDKLSTPIKCIPATTTGTCTSSTTTANLGIGQHATFEVTYKVTSGDLANGVINNSATASGNSATPNNPTKTTKVTSPPSTASVATANLVTSKIVSPASGTNVTPGEVLTYTLTFANTKGTAAAPVNYTDNLADVLDDATVTTPPALATGSGLTVSSITTTKGTFTVTGTVPAKTVDTVTYKVTVDAVTKDTTGNHVLNNYLVPTGTTPPSTCKATNTNCTTNAVPAITIVKTATPTTVTKVGQTITYKFVATNTGGTSLTNVSVTDKFTSPSSDKLSTPIKCIPATTTGTCTSSTTTANLGIGQHATFEVTYKVTSGDLANGVINNSATASGNSATPNNPTKTTKVTSPPSTASVKTVVTAAASTTPPVTSAPVSAAPVSAAPVSAAPVSAAPEALAFTGAPLMQELAGAIVLIAVGMGLILVDIRRRRRSS